MSSWNIKSLVAGKCKSHSQVAPAVFCGRICEAEGCGTLASNNYPGEKGRRFCAKHRLPGMVRTCWRGASAQARWRRLMSFARPTRLFIFLEDTGS